MPDWVAIQKREKAKGQFGAGRLNQLDKQIREKRKIRSETVDEYLSRGGKIKTIKAK